MSRFAVRLVSSILILAGCGGSESSLPLPKDAAAEAAPAVVELDAAPADAGLTPDAASDLPPATEDATPDVTAAGDAGEAGVATTCTGCYAEAMAAASVGACKVAKPNGCDDIPAEGVGTSPMPGDRALCQALDDCMKMTGCWVENGPSLCFCGTATNLTCTAGGANGACKAQIMAATKATSELQASTLLFSPNLPSGYAAQKYACYHASCRSVCR